LRRKHFPDGILQFAFGHSDIVRSDPGAAMSEQAVEPTWTCHGIVQFGIDQVFDCLSQRFSLATDHEILLAPGGALGWPKKRDGTPLSSGANGFAAMDAADKKKGGVNRRTRRVDPFQVPTGLADGLGVESLPRFYTKPICPCRPSFILADEAKCIVWKKYPFDSPSLGFPAPSRKDGKA
jgi:hypothetical protein